MSEVIAGLAMIASTDVQQRTAEMLVTDSERKLSFI